MNSSSFLGKCLLALTATLLLVSGVAQAQRENSTSITAKVACARIEQNLSVVCYLSAKTKGYEKLQLNVNHLSDPIKIKPDSNGMVHFYNPNDLPEKDKPARPIASFKASTAKKGVLAILLPASRKSKAIYNVKLIDSNLKFNYGCSCIVNLTNKDLYLRENDNKRSSKILKGRASIVKFPNANKTVGIQFYAPHSQSKKVTRFYSATWSLGSDTRELCLVYQKPGKKWPRTKVISESKALQLH